MSYHAFMHCHHHHPRDIRGPRKRHRERIYAVICLNVHSYAIFLGVHYIFGFALMAFLNTNPL